MKIAVQVYSVREHIKDTENLLKAIEEIKNSQKEGEKANEEVKKTTRGRKKKSIE